MSILYVLMLSLHDDPSDQEMYTRLKCTRSQLSVQVASYFLECWPDQAKHLNDNICSLIADVLWGASRHTMMIEHISPQLGSAGRYARLLLRHLTILRNTQQDWAELLKAVSPSIQNTLKVSMPYLLTYSEFDILKIERDRVEDLLSSIDHVASVVTSFLYLKPVRSHKIPIELYVDQLLREYFSTVGHKLPLGKGPSSKLVNFVGKCLTAIGRASSPATISEALRGRRERPRPGGRKKSKSVPSV